MADFSEDFFFDPGIVIKQEPLTLDTAVNISASVPIPGRRIADLSDYRDLQLNVDAAQSPPYQEIMFFGQLQNNAVDTAMWGTRDLETDGTAKQEFMHMDEDDIFKVDKADLIQGPTLAELNANDDTFLGDLNFDDLLLPEESANYINGLSLTQTPLHKLSSPFLHLNNNHLNNNSALLATSCPPAGMGYYRDSIDFIANAASNSFNSYASKTNVSPFAQASQPAVPIKTSPLSPPINSLTSKHSTLHELLMKQENSRSSTDRNALGQSVPGPSSPASNSPLSRVARTFNSRLSSSAPTHLGLEQIWQRREPRKHLLSTGSLAEAGSTSSLSTGGVLSPEAHDLSHDEQDYDEDSDHYEDFSSDDGDSDDDDDDHTSKGSKKERYFWQYNVQAKGPKGQRLVMETKMENPHVLNEVTDPVFSTECAVRGIKHSGKARKGDGNDLTPNPRKLFSIGKELDKLGRIINDMTPVSELPFNVRPKSRKEKNKLASRACRLKKKAQHEANKIKLHGLETEHKRLMNGISQLKHLVANKLKENSTDGHEQLGMTIEKITKNATRTKIAGQTTDYVNKILDKVKSGISSGGLEDVANIAPKLQRVDILVL